LKPTFSGLFIPYLLFFRPDHPRLLFPAYSPEGCGRKAAFGLVWNFTGRYDMHSATGSLSGGGGGDAPRSGGGDDMNPIIVQEEAMKFLVGFDESNVAKAALRLTIEHAKAFGASVHIVTSLEKGTEREQEDIRAAEEGLEAARSEFDAAGIPCKTHLLIRGFPPGEDLVRFAAENGIDQIVMGVKRRSKVGKLLMGSTAQYVILEAACPVLTIK
jgi:nucleotide-binding universal stress UspA family protein